MLISSRLFPSFSRPLWLMLLAALLLGCTARHDWREVTGPGGSYRAWMPAKPTTQSRTVALAGAEVAMDMMAARVGTLTYAIGSARLPDSALAPAALQQLKTALAANIDGHLVQERLLPSQEGDLRLEIEAAGTAPGRGQESIPLVLVGRLVAQQEQVYQVMVVGPADDIQREEIATFLTGFRLR